jgi:hypothetical protein
MNTREYLVKTIAWLHSGVYNIHPAVITARTNELQRRLDIIDGLLRRKGDAPPHKQV